MVISMINVLPTLKNIQEHVLIVSELIMKIQACIENSCKENKQYTEAYDKEPSGYITWSKYIILPSCILCCFFRINYRHIMELKLTAFQTTPS